MNFVSVLGLFTLLLGAWALSFHKKDVKLRPIFWGIGLQLILALTILGKGSLSYLGMIALGLLVVCYQLRSDNGDQLKRYAIGLPIVVGVAVFSLKVVPDAQIAILLVLLVVGILNAIFKFNEPVRPYVWACLISIGIATLYHNDITGQTAFRALSSGVANFLSLASYGSKFLFANLADPSYGAQTDTWPGFGLQFAFVVLPTIIFFGGFMSVLYYFGLIQIVIVGLSRFMRWTIGTSGAETLSCSANIFVGQTEAPLLVKPYISKMTNSELLTIMVGGFATVAGGVLAGYIAFGVPAGHILAAAVMSAPAALVVGKIIFPEKEHSATAGDVGLPKVSVGGNAIEAATNGISDGLRLAVNVGAMLLGFIALVAVIDVLLNWLDSLIDGKLLAGFFGGEIRTYSSGGMSPIESEYAGIFPGSLQTLFGFFLKPLAWIMGVPWKDAGAIGNLLGIKLTLNEFVAFGSLSNYINNETVSERGIIIATYALCGFANFSSIGIQIGGLSSLAPERRSDLAKVGLRAMLGGAIASWMTACIAGMFL